ncbi:signal peptide protein [Cryptosporidium ryanae]|uniref:signal peptide protein n=1 Tax=Cryptosporidium ryanae TaxID=515981 RepID=UPI003519EC72|nr:signal peptide protein [Cryptosporidium ryanae]
MRISKKLAFLLPYTFKVALVRGYDYFWYDPHSTVPLNERATNRWGVNDVKGENGTLKTGVIGGGYYGGIMKGVRKEEQGDAGNRTFGYLAKEYPYKLEEKEILFEDSLVNLSPEARLRFFRESFREYIFDKTGQLPSDKQLGRMTSEFKKYVKKEMDLTDSEVDAVFGKVTTSKMDGILPKYLMFDDMDQYDFDPEVALKYMPRVKKDATKEEIDEAYLKVYKMLGKNEKRLREIYNRYKEKYLERNPLGPVMTEKEFLLFSLKLREKEAFRLGFVPATKNPLLRNLDIAIFLRDKLSNEFEEYKKNGPKNIIEEALFTDKLIEVDDNEIPSPYDTLKGRFGFEGKPKPSEIVNITSILNDYERNYSYEDSDSSIDSLRRIDILDRLSSDGDLFYATRVDISSQNYPDYEKESRITLIQKRVFPKTPSQILFESSIHSASAQKRVIGNLDDFVLVDTSDMNIDQISRMFDLMKTSNTDPNIKEQTRYFRQRIGEQGKDSGTSTVAYRDFLNSVYKTTFFFIPKTVVGQDKFDSKGLVLPVPATGFEIKDLGSGRKSIHSKDTGLEFEVDYSGRNSLYLNNYLSTVSDPDKCVNIRDFINMRRHISDSILPAPERFLSGFDKEVANLESLNIHLNNFINDFRSKHTSKDGSESSVKSIEKIDSKTLSDASSDGSVNEFFDDLEERVEEKFHQIKEYEQMRDEYLETEKFLYNAFSKMKETLRTKLISEGLDELIKSYKDPNYIPKGGLAILKNSEHVNNDNIGALIEKNNKLKEIVSFEFHENSKKLSDVFKRASEKLDGIQAVSFDLIDFNDIQEVVDRSEGKNKHIKESVDKVYNYCDGVQKHMGKLRELHLSQASAVDLLTKNDVQNMGMSLFLGDEKIIEGVNKELFDIIKGSNNIEEYKGKIENSKSLSHVKYTLQKPGTIGIIYPQRDMSLGEYIEEDEDESKEKRKPEKKLSKGGAPSDLKDSYPDANTRLERVYKESFEIIEDLVRTLFIEVADNISRREELLKMESYLLNELRKHRASLSLLLGRSATFEDEIIDSEVAEDELRVRIILKIKEARTKLLYVTDVIDKLYFYPHYYLYNKEKISFKESIRLRKLEEEGILSKMRSSFDFTYYPRLYFDSAMQPLGIYGFNMIGHGYFMDNLYKQLEYLFGYDTRQLLHGLDIAQLIDLVELSDLKGLFLEASLVERSLYSTRRNMLSLLKVLIKKEKDRKRRRSLKRSYFKIKSWLQGVDKFERELFDSSESSSESSNNENNGTVASSDHE